MSNKNHCTGSGRRHRNSQRRQQRFCGPIQQQMKPIMNHMILMLMIVLSLLWDNNSHNTFVTAFSIKSLDIFRCNDDNITTTSTESCFYGLFTVMHSFDPNNSNICIESCIMIPGSTSKDKYFCGTCPTTSDSEQPITYQPGNLIVEENGLLLSAGLTAKIIGTKDQPVLYSNGTTSNLLFHRYPDAGATFIDPRPNNINGWIYVSNSEYRYKFESKNYLGGVGAITFDSNGNIIEYNKILYNTTANCAGGKTPWNTWVSCEEHEKDGTCYEVDPTGGYYTIPSTTTEDNNNIRPNNPIQTGGYNITLSNRHRGLYESFAYDIINKTQPRFYVTKDDPRGELRRFTPSTTINENENWNETNFLSNNNPYYFTLLQSGGLVDYLILVPSTDDPNSGTFYWIDDYTLGSDNAALYYPNVEGIDVVDNTLYFISKIIYSMFILNLEEMTYHNVTTKSGLFDGQPDQVDIVLHGSTSTSNTRWPLQQQPYASLRNHMLLYFTEDTNRTAGIHGRNAFGEYITILQSTVYNDETTGFAFSPDFKHFYFAYQGEGVLFDVSRQDGYPFYGSTLNVKYHGDTPE